MKLKLNLKPYTIPNLKTFKNGKKKLQKVKTIKWFTTPHRTIYSFREGEYQGICYTKFNPGSRAHIEKWLREDTGFAFPYYTAKGSVKVDVDSLGGMTHPAGKMLVKYLKTAKDQSQIGGAEGSLIKNYNEEKCIVSSRVDTNGTITSRYTSSSINLNQIPSQQEFRELFSAPEGWTFVGVDFSQQELVNLAHFLYPYDDGAYAETVANGNKANETDPHNVHKRLAGLDTRDQAKVFGFQYLYGAGEVVLGSAVLDKLLTDFTEAEYKKAKDKIYRRVVSIEGNDLFPIKKDKYVPVTELLIHQAIYGHKIVSKFESNFKGLKELKKVLEKEAKDTGHIKLPGGRVLPCRAPRNAVNTAMQGLGGTAMKYYTVEIHRALKEAGLTHGVDFIQAATIYDEIDMRVKDEYVDIVKPILEKAFTTISKQLNLNATYKGEAMSGPNWWTCH